MSAILPSGWRTAVDVSTGRTYYYNKTTKQTSWALPTGSDDVAGTTRKPDSTTASGAIRHQDQHDRQRRHVWKEAFDSNRQRSYWYNRVTRQTQWQRPSEAELSTIMASGDAAAGSSAAAVALPAETPGLKRPEYADLDTTRPSVGTLAGMQSVTMGLGLGSPQTAMTDRRVNDKHDDTAAVDGTIASMDIGALSMSVATADTVPATTVPPAGITSNAAPGAVQEPAQQHYTEADTGHTTPAAAAVGQPVYAASARQSVASLPSVRSEPVAAAESTIPPAPGQPVTAGQAEQHHDDATARLMEQLAKARALLNSVQALERTGYDEAREGAADSRQASAQPTPRAGQPAVETAWSTAQPDGQRLSQQFAYAATSHAPVEPSPRQSYLHDGYGSVSRPVSSQFSSAAMQQLHQPPEAPHFNHARFAPAFDTSTATGYQHQWQPVTTPMGGAVVGTAAHGGGGISGSGYGYASGYGSSWDAASMAPVVQQATAPVPLSFPVPSGFQSSWTGTTAGGSYAPSAALSVPSTSAVSGTTAGHFGTVQPGYGDSYVYSTGPSALQHYQQQAQQQAAQASQAATASPPGSALVQLLRARSPPGQRQEQQGGPAVLSPSTAAAAAFGRPGPVPPTPAAVPAAVAPGQRDGPWTGRTTATVAAQYQHPSVQLAASVLPTHAPVRAVSPMIQAPQMSVAGAPTATPSWGPAPRQPAPSVRAAPVTSRSPPRSPSHYRSRHARPLLKRPDGVKLLLSQLAERAEQRQRAGQQPTASLVEGLIPLSVPGAALSPASAPLQLCGWLWKADRRGGPERLGLGGHGWGGLSFGSASGLRSGPHGREHQSLAHMDRLHWRRRFFITQRWHLLYYQDDTTPATSPLGAIDLRFTTDLVLLGQGGESGQQDAGGYDSDGASTASSASLGGIMHQRAPSTATPRGLVLVLRGQIWGEYHLRAESTDEGLFWYGGLLDILRKYGCDSEGGSALAAALAHQSSMGMPEAAGNGHAASGQDDAHNVFPAADEAAAPASPGQQASTAGAALLRLEGSGPFKMSPRATSPGPRSPANPAGTSGGAAPVNNHHQQHGLAQSSSALTTAQLLSPGFQPTSSLPGGTASMQQSRGQAVMTVGQAQDQGVRMSMHNGRVRLSMPATALGMSLPLPDPSSSSIVDQGSRPLAMSQAQLQSLGELVAPGGTLGVTRFPEGGWGTASSLQPVPAVSEVEEDVHEPGTGHSAQVAAAMAALPPPPPPPPQQPRKKQGHASADTSARSSVVGDTGATITAGPTAVPVVTGPAAPGLASPASHSKSRSGLSFGSISRLLGFGKDKQKDGVAGVQVVLSAATQPTALPASSVSANAHVPAPSSQAQAPVPAPAPAPAPIVMPSTATVPKGTAGSGSKRGKRRVVQSSGGPQDGQGYGSPQAGPVVHQPVQASMSAAGPLQAAPDSPVAIAQAAQPQGSGYNSIGNNNSNTSGSGDSDVLLGTLQSTLAKAQALSQAANVAAEAAAAIAAVRAKHSALFSGAMGGTQEPASTTMTSGTAMAGSTSSGRSPVRAVSPTRPEGYSSTVQQASSTAPGPAYTTARSAAGRSPGSGVLSMVEGILHASPLLERAGAGAGAAAAVGSSESGDEAAIPFKGFGGRAVSPLGRAFERGRDIMESGGTASVVSQQQAASGTDMGTRTEDPAISVLASTVHKPLPPPPWLRFAAGGGPSSSGLASLGTRQPAMPVSVPGSGVGMGAGTGLQSGTSTEYSPAFSSAARQQLHLSPVRPFQASGSAAHVPHFGGAPVGMSGQAGVRVAGTVMGTSSAGIQRAGTIPAQATTAGYSASVTQGSQAYSQRPVAGVSATLAARNQLATAIQRAPFSPYGPAGQQGPYGR